MQWLRKAALIKYCNFELGKREHGAEGASGHHQIQAGYYQVTGIIIQPFRRVTLKGFIPFNSFISKPRLRENSRFLLSITIFPYENMFYKNLSLYLKNTTGGNINLN